MTSRWRSVAERAGWPAAAVIASIAPALVILASGRTFVWRDTATLFAPVRELIATALREARLPLWNPYEGFGLPLFAQLIHGVLHPVSVAHAWLFPGSGMEGLALAYLAAGTLGAWVLARELRCSPAASAVAAVAFGLSGYVQGLTAIVQLLAAGATAPWAIAGIRASRRGSGGGLAAGAAGVAALHLAGDPQWTLAAVALGLALAIEDGWSGVRGALASVAIGTGIAAVQLVPSWSYLGHTVRELGISAEDRLQWALAPARLLELIVPGFFEAAPGADVAAPVFLWLGGSTQWNLLIPFLSSVHVGAVVLALAVYGVRAPRSGPILAAAALVFLWLALGPAAGATQVLGWVPVWRNFRYAEKLVGPLTLCLSLLAGLGAERLAATMGRRGARLIGFAGLGMLGVGCLARLPAIPRAGWGAPEGAVAHALDALSNGLLLSGTGLALLGWASELSARRARPLRLPYVAAALVAISSVVALPSALRAGRRLPEIPVVVAADPDPSITRVETPLEVMPPLNPLGLDAAEQEIFAKARLGIASMNVPSKVDQVAPTVGLVPRNLRAFGDAFGVYVFPMMRRFGVSHVIYPESPDPTHRAIVEIAVAGGVPTFHDRAWGISAWRVPHLPFVRFADRVSAHPSPEAALEAMKQDDLAGVPETHVVGSGTWPAGRGEVHRVLRGTERLEVEASSASDGLLVVADAFWPGWKASIDGAPVEIVQADFVVRAVRWPAGRHVLRMSYDPPEVRVGIAVTAASALVLLLAVAWQAKRRGTRRAG